MNKIFFNLSIGLLLIPGSLLSAFAEQEFTASCKVFYHDHHKTDKEESLTVILDHCRIISSSDMSVNKLQSFESKSHKIYAKQQVISTPPYKLPLDGQVISFFVVAWAYGFETTFTAKWHDEGYIQEWRVSDLSHEMMNMENPKAWLTLGRFRS